jgi:UDP-2,4-diacetamido-2,4,6-trideoxy-beta-L-altropyranose hydrolase
MTSQVVLIRVDGSNQIGLGHVMRCMAIHEYFSKIGVTSIFVSREIDEKTTSLIQANNIQVVLLDPEGTVKDEVSSILGLRAEYGAQLMIADINNGISYPKKSDYHFFFEGLKTQGLFILNIDDFISDPVSADMVVIPYVGAKNLNIKAVEGSTYLLGEDYFIFREEFRNKAPIKIKRRVENVLVTMGGSDPFGFTEKILSTLVNHKYDRHLIIVIGKSSDLSESDVVAGMKDYAGSYEVILNSTSMSEVMARADLAIISSGLTKYESVLMGLPTIVVSWNETYVDIIKPFTDAGVIISAGNGQELEEHELYLVIETLSEDYRLREKLSRTGCELIDARGMERIVSKIPGSLLNKKEMYYEKNA